MKKIKILLICCLLALGSFSICFGAHFKAFATNNESNKYWDKIESVTSELFGDNKIISMDKLYNFNESPDYVYVEFKDGGYVVYFAETMEMMEFSLSGKLFYNLNNVSKKYYAGPTNIFIKKSGTFINPTTGQKIEQDSVFISDVSQQIYEMFLVTDTKERQNIKVGTSKITYKTGDISNETPDIDTGALIPGAPIGTINATYIPNAIYFTNNPTYGHNTHGTCGSVATQLLLGYNNYYNDRRIILPNHLNGEWNNAIGNGDIFDAGNYLYPSNNLNVCPNPENLNSNIIGTNYDFYNYVISNVEPNAFNCVCTTTKKIVNGDGTTTTIITIHYPDGSVSTNTTISSTQPGETNSIETVHSHNGSTISQVRNGLSAILGNRINSSEYIIDYDETGILSLWSPISSAPIKEEIDAGRPLIIGMRESLGGINHWVVGYGYQDYAYPIGHENANETYSGYVVHFGWTGKNCIWINESWCNSYISLELLHTHNHNIDTGKIVNNNKRELRCETCGHRQLTDLYSTCNNGSTISGVLYPISNNLIIPDSINGVNITSIGANAFENCTNLTSVSGLNNIVSIGAQAFKGCSSLTNISIPAGTTSIGAGAFAGCSNLNISVSSSNPNYSAQNNILYNKQKTAIIATGNIASQIILSTDVTSISSSAFEGNDNIKLLKVYGDVSIGNRAFYGCEELRDVYFYADDIPTVGVDAFPSDITFFVPYDSQTDFLTVFDDVGQTVTSKQSIISFVCNGVSLSPMSVHYGETMTNLPIPSVVGYSFFGWYDNDQYQGETYQVGDVWTSEEYVILYGQLVPLQFVVTLDANEGVITGSNQINVTYGTTFSTNSTVYREGYEFNGWYDNNDVKYIDEDGIGVRLWDKVSDTTLYAKWSIESYEIQINDDGTIVWLGANGLSDSSCSIQYGAVLSSINLVPTFKASNHGYKEGKIFDHFEYNNSTISWSSIPDLGENGATIIIIPKWVLEVHTIYFDENCEDVEVNAICEEYGTTIDLPDISREGYRFDGWYSDNTYSEKIEWITMPDLTIGSQNNGSIELQAKWISYSYSVRYNANGGTGYMEDSTHSYEYDQKLRGNTFQKSHYVFEGWATSSNGEVVYYDRASIKDLTALGDGDIILYAVWRVETFRITYANITFLNQTADVLLDNYIGNYAPTYYEYGVGLDLTRVSAFYQSSSPYSPQLRFLGWYTSMSFSTQKTSISQLSTSNVTIYAKWRYDYDNPSRIGTYTINNADPLNQTYYDQKYIGLGYNNLYQNLINIGITKLTFSFKLRSWGEGTQHIFVYNESGTQLASTTFSSTSSATVHTYQFTINLSSLGSSNYIYIRYQADTYWSWFQYKSRYWYCDYLYMEMSYVVNESDFYNPEFYWHYQDPFD